MESRRRAWLVGLCGGAIAIRRKLTDAKPSRFKLTAMLAIAATVTMAAVPEKARADLQLCNRMSFIVETALALEVKAAVATRGWFRIDPGQCRGVLVGPLTADHVYIHARALPVYGTSPIPNNGQVDLCVGEGGFTVGNARSCRPGGPHTARFSEIKPSETEKGMSATLAEDTDYDDDQARLAAIQRLLGLAGYDASPIDGVADPKTDAALQKFLTDRKLSSEMAASPKFFDILLEAAQQPEGAGFTWCNDTAFPVMAALGLDERGTVVTRGWYRIDPGKCLRPEVRGQVRRVFSYAEAVDADSRAIQRNGRRLAWGGTATLCTRDTKFELTDQTSCETNGLTSAGFAVVDIAGKAGSTVRFKEP